MVEIPVHQPEDRFDNMVKSKDRHEMSKAGQFKRIYPCESYEETEKYDKFLGKSIELYRDRFGIAVSR